MPGTVGTAVGRDVWSKILGKTSVEKLINKGVVLKTGRCSTGGQCRFLRTGVILLYLLVFALF